MASIKSCLGLVVACKRVGATHSPAKGCGATHSPCVVGGKLNFDFFLSGYGTLEAENVG